MMKDSGDSSHRATSTRRLFNFSVPAQSGNVLFSEEPIFTKENNQIWKSQILVPHPYSKHAYLGPIEKTESEELQSILPCYKKHSPLIFTQNPDIPYNLKFLGTKVFKAAPIFENNEPYLIWLNKLEKKERESLERTWNFQSYRAVKTGS